MEKGETEDEQTRRVVVSLRCLLRFLADLSGRL